MEAIIKDPQIHFEECVNTEQLLARLASNKYKEIAFPGCTTNLTEYLKCLNNAYFPVNKELLEGFGVTFRLMHYKSWAIKKILHFMNSKKFLQCLKSKFEITRACVHSSSIQKNLTHYEISPHPDIRQKALTYLLNINKDDTVESYDVHTHLLKFTEERQYVQEFWKTHPEYERCWVPWNWCETVKKIKKNNTLIVFSPSYNTLHAVKLNYPHGKFQRNQIYGNVWYKDKVLCENYNYKKF